MDLSNAHLIPASQAGGWIKQIIIFNDFLDELYHLEHNIFFPQKNSIFFTTIYSF